MKLLILSLLLAVPGAQGAVIKWDATQKTTNATVNATNASLTFHATNTSAQPSQFTGIKPSCGCTTTTAAKTPWSLPPGKSRALTFNTDLRGKRGTLHKSVLIYTTTGTSLLRMVIGITEPVGEALRKRNQTIARADRFAIFHGHCAKCHVLPTRSKLGRGLYRSACGICHDAEHRADLVTDLRTVKGEQNEIYWRHWITRGKSGTLMPPFAKANGGPLTEQQIESLITHLTGPWRKEPKRPEPTVPNRPQPSLQ